MKRILLAAIVFCMLVCGFACAEPAVPQSPAWVEGSTATATWDAVDGADYYELNVSVYDETGTVLLGSATTGTSATEADVQLQANIVINEQEKEYSAVKLAYTVKAGVTGSDGSITYGAESVLSPMWDYTFALIQLQPPENIVLNEDGTASWDVVEGALMYDIKVKGYADAELKEFAGYETTLSYLNQESIQNGVVSCNLARSFANIYNSAVKSGTIEIGESVYIHVQISSMPEHTSLYQDSCYSSASESVAYAMNELYQLQSPSNVMLNSDGIASWNKIDEASIYKISLFGYTNENRDNSFLYIEVQSYLFDQREENGVIKCNISGCLGDIYAYSVSKEIVEVGNPLYIYIKVQSLPTSTSIFSASEYSDPSESIEYTMEEVIQLQPPKEISLYPDGKASWKKDDNAQIYKIKITAYVNETVIGSTATYSYLCNETEKNGTITCNLESLFASIYNSSIEKHYIERGDKVQFCISVNSIAKASSLYEDSVFSEPSNIVFYSPFIPVESLTLSPAEPVVYVGNSYHLGITITPEDAYYTSVDWSTTDAATVTVDNTGLITGVKAGEAEVTAVIDEAKCAVPVMVYDISSNIEDEDAKNEAGDIIDDIVNNDDPDISDTDIPEEDLDNIQDDVREGIWRGDEFFTDMNWYEQEFGAYKNNWGQIQKAARLLNAQFAGAYNIEVEMYHKEKDGSTIHPIGCIEEFENDISFAFDLPTGMDEIRDGYARKYVLVRIHRNEIDTLTMECKDGQVLSSSDSFSDFVLLYVDTPTEPVDLSGLSTLTLPASTVTVEAEAFAGTAAEVVIIPEGCRSIGSRAFAGCANLKYIVVPSDWDITPANDAFDGCAAEILYR